MEHLLLADSVTRAVVYPRLEAPPAFTIRQVNTYSSQFDERAHKPHRNVADVRRQELAKKKYHTVVLGLLWIFQTRMSGTGSWTTT